MLHYYIIGPLYLAVNWFGDKSGLCVTFFCSSLLTYSLPELTPSQTYMELEWALYMLSMSVCLSVLQFALEALTQFSQDLLSVSQLIEVVDD